MVDQSEESLEVIVVNDGSWDHTAEIIKDYAAKDNRFVVINKDNGGVSSARNAGISAANGTYIWFVDSDDWLEADAVKTLQAVTAEKEYDTIMFSYSIVEYDGSIHPSRQPDLQDGYEFEQNDRDIVLKNLLSGNLINVWRSIFRTDFIRDNLFFDESQRNAEDVLFMFNLWSVCDKGIYINKALYNYRKNPDSLTRTFHPHQYANSQRARGLVFRATEHLWPDNSQLRQTYSDRYVSLTLKYIIRLFQTYKNHDKKERYLSLISVLEDDIFQEFAAQASCKDFGLIYGAELWLARRKMGRTIWLLNSCINSTWARRVNRLFGFKLQ